MIQNGGIKRSALHLPVSAQDETLLALVPLEGPTLGLRAGCVLRRALLAVEGGVIVACSIWCWNMYWESGHCFGVNVLAMARLLWSTMATIATDMSTLKK